MHIWYKMPMITIPKNETIFASEVQDSFASEFANKASASPPVPANLPTEVQQPVAKRTGQEMLERIARMLMLGFNSEQIAIAAASSPDEIEQLVKTQELQAELDRLITAKTEQAATVADGWDEIEANSLEVIKIKLANPFGVDEEFALKAAALANKASRGRAQQMRSQLPGGSVQDNAVIFLGATFVDNLQQNFTVAKTRNLPAVDKKVFNSLSTQDVSDLLGDGEDANGDALSLFDEGLSLLP